MGVARCAIFVIGVAIQRAAKAPVKMLGEAPDLELGHAWHLGDIGHRAAGLESGGAANHGTMVRTVGAPDPVGPKNSRQGGLPAWPLESKNPGVTGERAIVLLVIHGLL